MAKDLHPVVAIHQPNFFPWLGYLDKIARCDIFVFLDEVAYPKSGHSMGSWLNRVKVLVQNNPIWVGCSLVREPGVQTIRDVLIDNRVNWRDKLLKTLSYNYARAAYFPELWNWLEELVGYEEESLARYNIHVIKSLCQRLGLERTFVLQSELYTENSSTDLLVEITRKLGGKTYLCGDGAAGYQEDEKIQAAGLCLQKQNFIHPVYPQVGKGDFVPGLSIIDALMNCGVHGTKSLIGQN